jgi:hypothetical protein
MRATPTLTAALLCATSIVHAEVPSPKRALTDPKSVVSAANSTAVPVPIDDLGYSRGLLSSAWSADGKQLFLSTNLTGRYNIWRTDAAGSWPVQLTQGEDRPTVRHSISNRIRVATKNTIYSPFRPPAGR